MLPGFKDWLNSHGSKMDNGTKHHPLIGCLKIKEELKAGHRIPLLKDI